ncbi:hypothetical protein BU26DRAFT_534019 [Trematosphaeria pertusa]|uniref:RING-type domain-containing protein n=1 Tax=Trematosphaeria pertusa TaxID=390896 RepID=A0A6A6HZR5_9PLEO|nr:uncharacterized protein BU26DRAFT_534019 [Trematosphaeria pertusa]KAF2243724.1 hypothetical protein BU26DRAFT_534019 [Trematosphaeria pertusa]
MSGYEVEHNIPTKQDKPEHPPRRPDLSTFFSTLELVDTSDPQAHHNVHAVPQPENITAAFRLLANAFEMMRGRASDEQGNAQGGGDDLLASMIEVLRQNADDPPTELKGCPDSFLDELERVPKKSLKPTDTCPICVNPFLEDEYPLVVRLPCHKDHRFDLDCIRPWLKLNSTCPLDRKELLKKKQPPAPADEDEEEYDDMYA